MSWLIDDLNEQNIKLRRENNTKSFKFNRLIQDYSDLITRVDEISKQLDIKDNQIEELEDKIERYKVMIDEFRQDVDAIYPDFMSRLKFLWRKR